MTADYAKKVWRIYGGLIEKEIKKTTADDLNYFEEKFKEIIENRKQELNLK